MSEQPPQNPDSGWVPPNGASQPPPPPPPAYGAPQAPAPGYPAPPAYYGGPDAGPPPGKGMAITAFVLSIIPIGITQIIAIILSIITLRRVGRNEARGKGFAIAALVISIILILIMVLVGVVIGKENSRLNDNRDKGAGEIYSRDLRVGDCLVTFPSGDLKGTVSITPCSKPHGGEVFGVRKVDVSDSSTKQSRSDDSRDACVAAYVEYIGGSPETNKFDVTYFIPETSTLDDFDKAICVAGTGGKTTSSLKGTG